MTTLGHRLRTARLAAGKKQREVAALFGIDRVNVTQWESDTTRPETERLARLADFLGVSVDWLLSGDDKHSAPAPIVSPASPLPPPNARIGGPVDLAASSERIPVLGQAVGGMDGRFIFNGETMAEVFAPSVLWGVRNAYAVYVSGDSMEPRYFPGETVYVNPHMPARQGDFVVVQVVEDAEEPPTGYIKQFVSMGGDKLRLRQFNPAKDIYFPRARVLSVHKIVGSGI